MEAKNLSRKEQDLAVASELYTEKLISDILEQGRVQGDFDLHDPLLTASVIKAMLQDWYLKRSKYARRRITVDRYADFVLQFVGAFLRHPEARAQYERHDFSKEDRNELH
jgi:hypothetical protein